MLLLTTAKRTSFQIISVSHGTTIEFQIFPFSQQNNNIVQFIPICPPAYNCNLIEQHQKPFGPLFIHHITNDESMYGKLVPITFHAVDNKNTVVDVVQTYMAITGIIIAFFVFEFTLLASCWLYVA